MLMLSKFANPLNQAAPREDVIPLKDTCRDTVDIGDIVMSHWHIDKCIGKGSISTVYEAHHTGSQYRVYDASEMVQIELDNMVGLKGTGYIVNYEDHDAVENSDGSQDIIIRMELLQPLSDLLRSKRLSKEEVIRLGIDICKALEFCNKNSIIPCDVKPSNIYVNKWGGYKLGDFSASTKSGEKRNSDLMGTLKYMAPEVYAGKQFSSNIDTYSLGLVMYELLDSRSPVSKEAALYQRFSGAQLPRLPRSDEALQSIIMKACAYKPEDRFSSATEMLNELLKIEGRHGKESESM
jgi:serine/threonine protein kinase